MKNRLTVAQRFTVNKYTALASKMAHWACRKLPDFVLREDVEGVALEALCRAVKTHDAKKGPLEPWLRLKIGGALKDAYKDGRYPRIEYSSGFEHSAMPGQSDGAHYQNPIRTQDVHMYERADTAPTHEQVMIANQTKHSLARRLAMAFTVLSPQQFRVFQQSCDGLSLGDIAEIEQCSIAKVWKILAEAKSRLQYELNDLRPGRVQ